MEACAAAGEWLDEAPFELAGDHFALEAPRTGEYASSNADYSEARSEELAACCCNGNAFESSGD